MENIYKVAYEMILEELNSDGSGYSIVSISKDKLEMVKRFVTKMTEIEDKKNG